MRQSYTETGIRVGKSNCKPSSIFGRAAVQDWRLDGVESFAFPAALGRISRLSNDC